MHSPFDCGHPYGLLDPNRHVLNSYQIKAGGFELMSELIGVQYKAVEIDTMVCVVECVRIYPTSP